MKKDIFAFDPEREVDFRLPTYEEIRKWLLIPDVTVPINAETFVPSIGVALISSSVNTTVWRPFSCVAENIAAETKLTKPIKLFNVFKQHYKLNGALGFWKNNLKYARLFVLQESLNLAFREEFKRIIPASEDKTKTWRNRIGENLAVGLASGCATTVITHPYNVAIRRVQFDARIAGSFAREFKGVTDCLIKTFQKNVIFGLYRGLFLGLQEAIIFRSVYFGIYDTMNYYYCKRANCISVPILMKFFMASTSAAIGAALSVPAAIDFIGFMNVYMAKESSVKAVATHVKLGSSTVEKKLIKKAASKRILVASLLISISYASTLVIFEEIMKLRDEF